MLGYSKVWRKMWGKENKEEKIIIIIINLKSINYFYILLHRFNSYIWIK